MKHNPWLVSRSGKPRSFRLVCFSYAGGSATIYASWQALVDQDIDICAIQLPGRGSRLWEPSIQQIDIVVQEIVRQIQLAGPALPFALFGHSLGGLLAFEVARELAKQGLPLPECLMASGCAAPRHRSAVRRIHEMNDDDLIAALADYNGTPSELLQNRELMELVAPAIRADFRLVADYTYKAAPLLNLPIVVFTGTQDTGVTHEQALGWQEETTAPLRIHTFNGGHFFIDTHPKEVVHQVNAELVSLLNNRRIDAKNRGG